MEGLKGRGITRKGRGVVFVVGEDIHHHPKKVTYGRAHKIHETHKKVKVKAIGIWKAPTINSIRVHDVARLADKPHITGEIRHIHKKSKKVEFSHKGAPIFINVSKVRVWVRRKHKVKKKK
jgi:hypothetical protein